jgi:acetyl esterase
MKKTKLLFAAMFVFGIADGMEISGGKEKVMLSEKAESVCSDLAFVRRKLLEETTSAITPQLKRATSNRFFTDHSGIKKDMEKIEDFRITGSTNEMSMRLYSPYQSNKSGIIMYLHGGGWMQGNLETHDYLCREIAAGTGIEVIAAEYRLAPEHVFPVHLDDVFDIYLWCCEHYADREIIISGDSAGGNLCAALCIKLKEERRGKKPAAQVLFYPSLSNNFDSDSFKRFGDISALTRDGTIAYLSQYIGTSPDEAAAVNNKFVYPLLEDNTDLFPKTILVSAQYDVLLDEQKAFAEKLRKNCGKEGSKLHI